METCPHCLPPQHLVQPRGPSNAPIIIISEFPGEDELRSLSPFTGFAGRLLKKELGRVGIDMNSLRITNLWLHAPNKIDACFNFGLEQAIAEAKGRKFVLLMGSDVVKTFTGYNVSDVCGLQVESELLSAPYIYATTNPASLAKAPVGEFRLAVEKINKKIEEVLGL